MTISRCSGVGDNPLSLAYHDSEWGYPQHDDRVLFEHIVLVTFQGGLSWQLMLQKREGFRTAFSGFDPVAVAHYDEADVERLLNDSSIIRNQAKIRGVINNARCVLKVQDEFGSFDRYVWQFTGGGTFSQLAPGTSDARPNRSRESEAMANDLRRRDFQFVGPITCYSFMQSIGMLDGHERGCFRSKHRDVLEGSS